jgi:hypothetical protein
MREKAMPQSERSLQQIRQETEQARGELTQTVEQLRNSAVDVRERIRPAAVKAEIAQYVRSRGENLVGEITSAARNNPLQAVAVAGSVAYPLLRLVRAVPAPVLLIGVGFYLAGSKSGKAVTENLSSIAGQVGQRVTRQAQDMFGDQAEEATANVSAPGAEMKERVVRSAEGATQAVKDFVEGATTSGQQLAEKAMSSANETVQAARETASRLKDRASDTLIGTLEQNPLLVAGLGLLVGGVIASVVPRSTLEDEWMGETSRSVKRRAQSAASGSLNTAKEAASEGIQRASSQAEAEGIDPEGIGEAMRDVGQRVKRVAEAAVTTAFEPAEKNDQSDIQGARNNG